MSVTAATGKGRRAAPGPRDGRAGVGGADHRDVVAPVGVADGPTMLQARQRGRRGRSRAARAGIPADGVFGPQTRRAVRRSRSRMARGRRRRWADHGCARWESARRLVGTLRGRVDHDRAAARARRPRRRRVRADQARGGAALPERARLRSTASPGRRRSARSGISGSTAAPEAAARSVRRRRGGAPSSAQPYAFGGTGAAAGTAAASSSGRWRRPASRSAHELRPVRRRHAG